MFQQQQRGPQQEIDLEQFLERISAGFNRVRQRLGGGGMSGIIILGFLLIAILWLATGIYTVDPAEQAALRLFGKFTATSGPGLHWYFPAPIGTKNVEKVTETRRMELGFRTLPGGGVPDVPIEAIMITGDENIVDVQMVVQYRIKNLREFLFNVSDPGEADRDVAPGRPEGRTLKDVAEVAIRQVVGSRNIDDVLTIEKEAVQSETKMMMQGLLDDYQAGILITEVKLQKVRPPAAVQSAFEDVVRAKEDKETAINQAQAYQQDIIPRARGSAEQVIKAAEAFKAERIAKAIGESSRFLSVLEEYQKSREVTRQRLFLEAMEEILPGITKFIVSQEAGGSLLQFLPLSPSTVPQLAPEPQPSSP